MKERRPLFSVIVPVYKAEAYLRECVDSVLDQTYENFELILVDDGSPDNCGAICDEYAARDPRVKVIHKPNGGPTSARKAAAGACVGDYVMFLDSDDYYDSGLLASLAAILAEHRPDVIAFNYIHFSGEQQERIANAVPPGIYRGAAHDVIGDSLILDAHSQPAIRFSLWSKVLRRDLYVIYQEQVPTCLIRGEDLAVVAPLMAHCGAVYVADLYGYYYRDTPNSVMHTFRPSDMEQIRLLNQYLKQALDKRYWSRCDTLSVLEYREYLDGAMAAAGSHRAYRALARQTTDHTFLRTLVHARCHCPDWKDRVLFTLAKHRSYSLLWLIRRVRGKV